MVFVTHELPHEAAACACHHAKAAGSDNPSLLTYTAAMPIAKTKQFNLTTPKLLFLGDYVSTIKQFGTTDSYPTHTVRVSW